MSSRFANSSELLKAIQDLLEENKKLWHIEESMKWKKISTSSPRDAMKICRRIAGILKNTNEENAGMKLKNVLGLLGERAK